MSEEKKENQLAALLRSADFAAQKHTKQRRKDSDETPYINHPIGVAHILANEAGVTDLDVLQAAVLHDTVEDTDTTLNEIEWNFGERVRGIVAEVTDDKSLPKQERKKLQIVHAATASREAKLVKLADKLYNLRDLSSEKGRPKDWGEERVREYFGWARDVVSAMAGTHPGMEADIMKLCEKGAPTSTILEPGMTNVTL